MPNRLAELDFPDRVGSRLPLPVSQALVGIGCTAASFGTRALLDLLLPGAGPFALIFPFVLIATLVDRWQAGVLTMILSALF
ncbi:MAG: histidine kinase, partial [Sphingorhabdus sp.]|nr:histidine kinase [Sphingorhabdus sp.]